MNPARDGLIIIIVIIGLGVVAGAIGNSGSTRQPLVLPGAAAPSVIAPTVKPKALTEAEEQKEIEAEIAKVQAELIQVEAELAKIEKYGEPSPYAGMVTMSKNSGVLGTTNVDGEYIYLAASSRNKDSIVITGWKLESAISGKRISIPKAVRLVLAGSSGSEQPVALVPGDIAYITTGRSPIGPSFRVNKCMGYYTQFQTFFPTMRERCPAPSQEILSYSRDESIFIDNACMDFVDRMAPCRINTRPLPQTLSFACQEAIINEINYNSCVDKHKNDADFLIADWRIYLKRDEDLWRTKRELIKLLDENGKTVDYYSY